MRRNPGRSTQTSSNVISIHDKTPTASTGSSHSDEFCEGCTHGSSCLSVGCDSNQNVPLTATNVLKAAPVPRRSYNSHNWYGCDSELWRELAQFADWSQNFVEQRTVPQNTSKMKHVTCNLWLSKLTAYASRRGTQHMAGHAWMTSIDRQYRCGRHAESQHCKPQTGARVDRPFKPAACQGVRVQGKTGPCNKVPTVSCKVVTGKIE